MSAVSRSKGKGREEMDKGGAEEGEVVKCVKLLRGAGGETEAAPRHLAASVGQAQADNQSRPS